MKYQGMSSHQVATEIQRLQKKLNWKCDVPKDHSERLNFMYALQMEEQHQEQLEEKSHQAAAGGNENSAKMNSERCQWFQCPKQTRSTNHRYCDNHDWFVKRMRHAQQRRIDRIKRQGLSTEGMISASSRIEQLMRDFPGELPETLKNATRLTDNVLNKAKRLQSSSRQESGHSPNQKRELPKQELRAPYSYSIDMEELMKAIKEQDPSLMHKLTMGEFWSIYKSIKNVLNNGSQAIMPINFTGGEQ